MPYDSQAKGDQVNEEYFLQNAQNGVGSQPVKQDYDL